MKLASVIWVTIWMSCGLCLGGSSGNDLLFETVRQGDAASLRLLLLGGAAADEPDETGMTPLMRASLSGSELCMRLLLDHGADPNAQDGDGVTPLMYGVHDIQIVRLLLKEGADPNQISKLKNSALILAARYSGNQEVVRLLLSHGSKLDQENFTGVRALQAAAAGADLKMVSLLLSEGADVNHLPLVEKGGRGFWGHGSTALMWAASRGSVELARVLIAAGADVNAGAKRFAPPLTRAAMQGHAKVARVLLDHGARVQENSDGRNATAYPPLMWALADGGRERVELVKLLLDSGAKADRRFNPKNDGLMEVTQTPLGWAAQHGNTEIIEVLIEAGAKATDESLIPQKRWESEPRKTSSFGVDKASLAVSVDRAVGLLETSALESRKDFEKRGTNCNSCHQQMIPMMALGVVKNAGLRRDEGRCLQIEEMLVDDMKRGNRFNSQPAVTKGIAVAIGYTLNAFSLEKIPSSLLTDLRVHTLASAQFEDGSWDDMELRPPISGSVVANTALALRALRSYPIPGRRFEFDERVRNAAVWLRQTTPYSNEDQVFQLLGLRWAGEDLGTLSEVVQRLLAKQRANGGWAQLDGLESDAYATGQALYALQSAGGVSVDDESVQRGLQFLLATQTTKGSWHVRRRAYPFQRTYDGAFPHGRDTWISAAATSWAVMALSEGFRSLRGESAEPFSIPSGETIEVASLDVAKLLPAPANKHVEFERDIRPLFEESCLDCHGGSARVRGRLSMNTRMELLKGGRSNSPSVMPGASDSSPLILHALGLEEDEEMPPAAKREFYPAWTNEEVALVRAWIDQGAEWPVGLDLTD